MPLDRSATYDLIRYVAEAATDRDVALGRTKLVKLLYLMDIWHLRDYGERLTDFNWVFYHYGPYIFELPRILDALNLDLPQEERFLAEGRTFQAVRHVGPSFHIDPERRFGSRGAQTVTRVLDEWLEEDLNQILNYVYFQTEPMLVAEKRGEALDLTTVKRQFPESMLPSSKSLSPEAELAIRNLRQHERESLSPTPLEPRSRYDGLYRQALASLEPDASLPETDIEFGTDVDFGEPRQRT